MATPTLRALRVGYRDAQIIWVVKPYARPVIDGSPWANTIVELGKSRSMINVAAQLHRMKADVAVLLPNSFRSALLVRMASIERRIGYDRDGRGFMLTDGIKMRREPDGKPPVIPAIDYYLRLAQYMGLEGIDRRMELFTQSHDDEQVDSMLATAGVDVNDDARPIVILNPGAANHGDAKLWPAERFAAVADSLIDSHNAAILVNGSPKERPILDKVHAASDNTFIDLPKIGSNLTLLKSFAKRSRLMITNDTGPRHIAAALDTPVVSLFGPTDPEWTRLDAPHETLVRDPSHKMDAIDVDTVVEAGVKLLDFPPPRRTLEPSSTMAAASESDTFEVD